MKVDIAYRAILWAGLICGVLDGLSAIAVAGFFGVTAIRVFQGIASGLIGRSSFQGGAGSALMGVALHFLVAFGAATAYYAASRRLPFLIDHALVCGIAFGLAVHLFMTFVVIPLSAIGTRPFVPRSFVAYLIVSMLVVGPSISLTVRRFSR
jgi:hypothetical protein